MRNSISVWEDDGGSLMETSDNEMTGTVNQIAWAKQIKEQVNAEFDRVAAALGAAAATKSGQARMDTETMVMILEDKRSDVMANQEAGYFIHDWQELRDQVRQMIIQDGRYEAVRTGKL